MPAFVALLINHRPPALRGRSLAEVMDTGARQPARLSALFQSWQAQPVGNVSTPRRLWSLP